MGFIHYPNGTDSNHASEIFNDKAGHPVTVLVNTFRDGVLKTAPSPGWFRALLLITVMATVVWLSSMPLLVPFADFRWQLPERYHVNAISSNGSEVLIAPRGNNKIVVRDVEREIRRCDAKTGIANEHVDIRVEQGELFYLSFSPDDRFVILAQNSQQLLYHSASRRSFRFDSIPQAPGTGYQFFYDQLMHWSLDNKLVVIKTPKELVLWDTSRLQTIASLPVPTVFTIFERYPELWFTPQGTSLVTIDKESTVTIWDTTTGKMRSSLAIPTLMEWKRCSTQDPACRFLDEQTAIFHIATRQLLQRTWQDHFIIIDLHMGRVLDTLHLDGIVQNTGSITDEETPSNICIMYGDRPIWRRELQLLNRIRHVYSVVGNRFVRNDSAAELTMAWKEGTLSPDGKFLHDIATQGNDKFHELIDCTTGLSKRLNPVGNHEYSFEFSKNERLLKIRDRYIYEEPLWNNVVDSIKFIKLPRMSTTHHKLNLWSLPEKQNLISLTLHEGSHEFLNEAGTRLVVQHGSEVQVYNLPSRDGRWWFMGLCAIAAICSIYLIASCFRRSSNPAPVNDIPPSPSHQG